MDGKNGFDILINFLIQETIFTKQIELQQRLQQEL
jgi:hypothetical protein